MQEITATQTPTLPEKLRKEHQPQTGDVYLHHSHGYEVVSERAPVFRRGKKAN